VNRLHEFLSDVFHFFVGRPDCPDPDRPPLVAWRSIIAFLILLALGIAALIMFGKDF